MKQALITRIDNGTAPDWAQIPLMEICEPVLLPGTSVAACGQICYDATALYLHLFAKEDEILAREYGPLAMPCRDSCLEFFFCPIEGDRRYFNFEFNPAKCLFLGLGAGSGTVVRLLPQDDPDWILKLFCPEVAIHPDGWEITYRIPFSFIRRFFPDFAAKAGSRIRGNFYKCADLAQKPHYLCWNPVTGTTGSVFHAPEDFGELTFA